jgi:hypothetical protein
MPPLHVGLKTPMNSTTWIPLPPALHLQPPPSVLPSVVKHKPSWALTAHTCNPSYSGGRDREDHGSKAAQANSSQDPILKNPSQKKYSPEFKPQYWKKTKNKHKPDLVSPSPAQNPPWLPNPCPPSPPPRGEGWLSSTLHAGPCMAGLHPVSCTTCEVTVLKFQPSPTWDLPC